MFRCANFIELSLFNLLLILAFVWLSPSAIAKPQNITENEMQMIPLYCPDTQGFKYGDAYSNTSPNAKKWVAKMGTGFWAVHYYCWAMINLQRAMRHNVTPQYRTSLLESVVADSLYVVNNTPSDFILLPEILTRIGEAELRLSHPDKANKAFEHARELKPDYWPAYSHWVEYLMKVGRRDEALKVVISGLEQSPKAKVLREQYRILGGKMLDIPKAVKKPLPADEANEPLVPTEKIQPEPDQKQQEENK